jgi:hypothetical protein
VTVVIAKGYAWIADKDGVAHAQPSRGRPRLTLCQITAIEPRFAQPARVKCERCQEVADKP